jgi:predicted HTH transcriptional regulator
MIRFDESPLPGTSPLDVDAKLVERLAHGVGPISTQGLRELGVLADNGAGDACLTVAGALMCARRPERWLPNAQIQAVSYVSADRNERFKTDARDIVGPLDQQVRDALHFVRRNMFVPATKVTARTEFPQFSERAVFEALVNAVAHRDYSMAGARIRMHMFGDRLELYVPGALASTLTPDSMHLRHHDRNELVVSLLARCPTSDDDQIGRAFFMDRRGKGVPLILEQGKRLSGRAPEYTLIDESELRLVIWAAPDPHADA